MGPIVLVVSARYTFSRVSPRDDIPSSGCRSRGHGQATVVVCLFVYAIRAAGARPVALVAMKRERGGRCVYRVPFYGYRRTVCAVGARRSSLKIECQPRKRCHNIPHACYLATFLLRLLSLFFPPLRSLLVSENTRRTRQTVGYSFS